MDFKAERPISKWLIRKINRDLVGSTNKIVSVFSINIEKSTNTTFRSPNFDFKDFGEETSFWSVKRFELCHQALAKA